MKKKIISWGLVLGMVLNSVTVFAAEDEIFTSSEEMQIEDTEEILVSSEETESEDTEEISDSSDEIESEDAGEVSVMSEETENREPEESLVVSETIENKDVEEFSAESEVAVSGKCGENITFELTKDGVMTLSGSGPMPTIKYDWKYYEPICGWGNQIKNIKKLVVEKGITSISQYSFYDCENLVEVTIPDSVESIGYEAFHWCPNITKVMIDSLESWCQIDFDENNANPLQFGANLYVNGVKKTQIIIPDGITEIKPYAFCRSWTNDESKMAITNVQLSNTVKSIDNMK